jgi:hypothetical protein
MALMHEDIDAMSNTNKTNEMILSGLSCKTSKPVGAEEGRKWLKNRRRFWKDSYHELYDTCN